MKIAYDAKRFFNNASGLGNYSRDLVRILSEYAPGNQYILLSSHISERGAEILKSANVSFLSIPKSKFSRQLKMGKEAQQAGADIFHGLSGELPLKWDPTPIKKILTIHDVIFVRFPQYYSFFDRNIHLWKFRKAAKCADVIIAISEQTKSDIVQFLKVPEEKIFVVYQGCHTGFKQFISPDFLDETRKKFSLPPRFVLSVGTIEPRKNLLNILRALKNSNIPLVVVGRKQKNYFRKIEKFLAGNSMKVQFLENADMKDLAAIYRLADVFIYPSYFEGFGIPVIEALFSGTPVIAANTSSLREAGGGAALYVDPDQAADIRAKIDFLWNNESERTRLRMKGFEHSERFRDHIIAENILNVYNLALNKK